MMDTWWSVRSLGIDRVREKDRDDADASAARTAKTGGGSPTISQKLVIEAVSQTYAQVDEFRYLGDLVTEG